MNRRIMQGLIFLDKFWDPGMNIVEDMGRVFLLSGRLLRAIFKLMLQPVRLRDFYLRPILEQMVRVGVNSIPVVITTALFTGMVLAIQTGVTMESKIAGSSIFIGNIVSLSLLRELGPVLTALLVTGRVGSAIAAEIGSMKITEQIDALRTLAAEPVEYLGIPRFVAMLVMLPVLTVLADVLGTMGGWMVSSLYLEISSTVYWDGVRSGVESLDILSGLIKSLFFAAILCIFALHRGFSTQGGAVGVGRATTSAVVNASITILIVDYFLAQTFALF